jgi:hypothetical protein
MTLIRQNFGMQETAPWSLLVCRLPRRFTDGRKQTLDLNSRFDSYYLGVATNPCAVVLVGIVKPTSIPSSLTPFTRVKPTPLGSSTEV